jgi:1-aminocyclopropane-1-carboxylate deaminase
MDIILAALTEQFHNPYIIPEGGANELGRKGAGDIAKFISSNYNIICLSVGTGTTFAGLRDVLNTDQELIGFAPMKGGKYLEKDIRSWLSASQDKNWSITDQYHFGGFGKTNTLLASYMQTFEREQGIALDRVYTAKMMYGVADMISQSRFPSDSKILCVHTGGLQGNG